MTYTPGNGYPTLDELRVEVGVSATVMPDEVLEPIAGAEQDGVNTNYEWASVNGVLPDKMFEVFVVSVARAIASRGLPLGMAADAEGGTVKLSARNPEIVRIGGQYRKRVFA